jgi:hypothetical protein
MSETYRAVVAQILASSPSRRAALGGGLALFALTNRNLAAAQEATPEAGATANLVAVHSFSNGTLFPTQGSSPDLPPYTLILWNATGAGLFFVDRLSSAAGIIPTDRVLQAITASSPARAALVAHPDESASTDQDDVAWALELVLGSAGSDPGAVTYQGDVRDDPTASTQFGIERTAPPDGPRNFGPGYLIFPALPGLDTQGEDVVRLTIE